MNRKAIFSVAMVFVLGVAVGALGFSVAKSRVQAQQRLTPLQSLTQEVGLDAQQQQQISVILDETKKNFESIYGPIRPQMEAARQQGRQRIRAILTQEQLVKYEERVRRMDEERAKRNAAK
jgi:hypothetical protein